MANEADVDIIRGNNASVVWQFLTDLDPETFFDITGSQFVLTISVDDEVVLEKDSADGGLVINTGSSKVTWAVTVAESRLIPVGRIARYELERRISGTQTTLVRSAYFIGIGGINND